MRWMLFIGVGVLTYGSIICAEGINVEGKPVPPLAIRDLTVKINGDAHVFGLFLTKTEIRSAMDANAYTADIRTTKSGYLESDSADGSPRAKDPFRYKVMRKLPNNIYVLHVEQDSEGSLGRYDSVMFVKVEKRSFYEIFDENKISKKDAQVLIKLGVLCECYENNESQESEQKSYEAHIKDLENKIATLKDKDFLRM